MMEGKRTVDDIKREVAEGKWRCVTPEQEAREIIRDLASVDWGKQGPEFAEVIARARRYVERVQSLDVGAGDVNTDFGTSDSGQA